MLELPTVAPLAPRVPFRRAIAPGLAYRLAAWRRHAALGGGQLVVRASSLGSARLEYCNPASEGRPDCLQRQAWILRVPPTCGASRATLREEGCIAEDDPVCRYVVTWSDGPRILPAALIGLLAAVTLAVTRGPLTTWLVPPALVAGAYALEHRRVARANLLASTQSGAAFQWLVAQALAGRPAEPESPTAPAEPAAAANGALSIEKDGDTWRVGYEGRTHLLRHSRGLALLSHLVRNPGQEVHVSTLDTITPSGGSAPRNSPADGGGLVLGDAGEVLDAQARKEYRRRIDELREALEDAEGRADAARSFALRAELESLEDELRLAVAPGGRPRRAASDAERLRVAITHRIRDAIAQIARRDPDLGGHLRASVSTGYRCVYEPRADREQKD